MRFPVKPKHVQIELSNRCNLSCPLCPKGLGLTRRKNKDLAVSFFTRLINALEEHNPELQLWNYGEPLLHREIFSILGAISDTFDKIILSTNGTVMTERLARAIVTCGITEINVAVDGITQETYERYRVGGSLKQVLKNLQTLITSKEQLKADLKINVQYLILKHNVHDIKNLGTFFQDFNVDEIRIKSAILMPYTNEEELTKLANKYLYLQYSGERYAMVENSVVIRSNWLKNCPLIEDSFVITTDVEYLPCCWDYGGQFPITTPSQYTEVKALINSDNPPIMCKRCPIRNGHVFSWEWNELPELL